MFMQKSFFLILVCFVTMVSSCTLVKYQQYTLRGRLEKEIVVRKNRKVITRDIVHGTRTVTKGRDSVYVQKDSCNSDKIFYVDSLMWRSVTYYCKGEIRNRIRIKRYVEQPHILSSGDTVVILSQFGKCIYRKENGKLYQKLTYRFGMTKQITYENGKREVYRYRVVHR